MAVGNRTGRNIAEKTALFAIFIISLLTAWLVTEMRSVIRLSAPIELSRCGLSVSMPSGNGWQCEKKWIYDGDSFALSSVLAVGGGTSRSYARCRYLLAAQKSTLQERFEQEASAVGGELLQTGRQTVEQLVVDWAKIEGSVPGKVKRQGRQQGRSQMTISIEPVPFEMIFGVCELGGGRRLEVEIFQTADERELLQEVFELIAKSIRFSNDGLLEAGIGLVKEVRDSAPRNIKESGSEGRPIFFVITDARGKSIGFTMDVTVVSQADANSEIKAASYYYSRGTAADEQISLFRGDLPFDKFTWRAESSSRAGRKGTEITAAEGILMVRKLQGGGEESEYALGGAAVPDIVIEPVLVKMLDSDLKAVIIDVIRPDGTIAPVFVEKMDQQADSNALRVELLDGRGIWQQIYYDSSKKPIKIIIEQEETYTLRRADSDEIEKMFPERADLIRDRSRLLDHEGI
jgi:hypothetical protein